MEENTTTTEMQGTEATPTTQAPMSMEMGGVSDSPKLGWVAIMMLGLTSASLIYSIFYYRKRTQVIPDALEIILIQDSYNLLIYIVVQRPAKPWTAVRFRSQPPSIKSVR